MASRIVPSPRMRPVLGQAATGLAHEPHGRVGRRPRRRRRQERPTATGLVGTSSRTFVHARRGYRPRCGGAWSTAGGGIRGDRVSWPNIRHFDMTQQHPDLADEQAYIDSRLRVSRAQPRPPRGGCGTSTRPTSAARSRPASSATSSTRRWSSASPTSTSATPRSCSAASTATPRRPTATRELPHRAPGRGRRGLASRSWSTGGRRSPSRSTGPPGASRWASPAAATSPSRAASCSASRTSCSATGHLGVGHDEGLDATTTRRRAARAARLQHAARRARARAHRHARRHRRHHPGRAGRDHPLPAGRRARRAGRPGHRQDGRGAAPRRLPALHLPLPARGPGRAGHRPQPRVPALHRAGAAVARRGRRRAGRARRPRARRRLAARYGDRPARLRR